jgi:hypothetical protein
MKQRASPKEKRPLARKAVPAIASETILREDGNFMDLDDWLEDEDDFFDEFFPEEVKRR